MVGLRWKRGYGRSFCGVPAIMFFSQKLETGLISRIDAVVVATFSQQGRPTLVSQFCHMSAASRLTLLLALGCVRPEVRALFL